jgi:phospholipid transport system substrate-binding protein
MSAKVAATPNTLTAVWPNRFRRIFQAAGVVDLRPAVCAILIMLATLCARPAVAQDDPQAVVFYVGTQGMAALAPQISPAQRTARLRSLFADYFDVGHLAAFALGRYRAIATPLQHQQFANLYLEYTVATYGAQLSQFGLAPFRVTGMHAYGGQPVVSSEIVRPDGRRVQIDWHLVDQDGTYKISDVVIGGYSMEITQRNDFAQWIQNNGGSFDALLAIMRQQIAQLL